MDSARDKKWVLVTGAAGFIGRHVVQELLKNGFQVAAMVRRRTPAEFAGMAGLKIVRADLTDLESLKKVLDRDIWAVVHLAAAKNDEKESHEVNAMGARRLIDACRAAGCCRIVNVSTQSAKLAEKGLYGATKAEADAAFDASGLDVTTLYVSLVYAEKSEGAFAAVQNAARKLPFVPVLGDGQWVSAPVHARDVAAAVRMCLERSVSIGKRYDIAGEQEVSFDDLIDKIAGRPCAKLHVPYRLALSAVKMARRIAPRFPLSASNVLGSNQNTAIDIAPARRDLDFKPSGLEENLRCAALLREGAFFSRYLMGHAVSSVLVARYAEANRVLLGGRADEVGSDRALAFAERHPWSLPLLDAAAGLLDADRSFLRKKLQIAAAVLETDPSESAFFLKAPEPLWATALYGLVAGCSALAGTPLYLLARKIG